MCFKGLLSNKTWQNFHLDVVQVCKSSSESCCCPHVSCPVSSCRVGGGGNALFLLGGGPGAGAAERLGLPAGSDFALRALSASHRLHERASDCLQEGGAVFDWIWWVRHQMRGCCGGNEEFNININEYSSDHICIILMMVSSEELVAKMLSSEENDTKREKSWSGYAMLLIILFIMLTISH